MSFHPADAVRHARSSTSRSATLPTKGRRSRSRRSTARSSSEIATQYPPEQRKSAVLPALYLVQEQQGYITAQRDAPRRRA